MQLISSVINCLLAQRSLKEYLAYGNESAALVFWRGRNLATVKKLDRELPFYYSNTSMSFAVSYFPFKKNHANVLGDGDTKAGMPVYKIE